MEASGPTVVNRVDSDRKDLREADLRHLKLVCLPQTTEFHRRHKSRLWHRRWSGSRRRRLFGPRRGRRSPLQFRFLRARRRSVKLRNGVALTFEQHGTALTIHDKDGRILQRSVWTESGAEVRPVVQTASGTVAQVQNVLEAGRQLYNWLAERTTTGQRACLAFTAREYEPSRIGLPGLTFAGILPRTEVENVCQRLNDVQQLTDEAAREVTAEGRYTSPQTYGTAVHTKLKSKILRLNDPNLSAEFSLFKAFEEDPGTRSIRIDVIEEYSEGTICIYDIKTGKSGLTAKRVTDFARRIAKRGRPVVIIEVRPYE